MTAAELLAELAEAGVRLTASPAGLDYDAPRGVLTAELRELIAARRGELIELLTRPAGPPRSTPRTVRGVELDGYESHDFLLACERGELLIEPSTPAGSRAVEAWRRHCAAAGIPCRVRESDELLAWRRLHAARATNGGRP